MSSTVITVVLIGIMVLVIASLVLCGLQAQRRHNRALAKQATAPLQPLEGKVTMILHLHEGVVVGAEQPVTPHSFSLPSSWYTRRRTLVSISFLLMVFLALFVQTGLAQGALHELGRSVALFSDSQAVQAAVNPVAHPPISTLTASQRIVRVNSADRNQYYNDVSMAGLVVFLVFRYRDGRSHECLWAALYRVRSAASGTQHGRLERLAGAIRRSVEPCKSGGAFWISGLTSSSTHPARYYQRRQ